MHLLCLNELILLHELAWLVLGLWYVARNIFDLNCLWCHINVSGVNFFVRNETNGIKRSCFCWQVPLLSRNIQCLLHNVLCKFLFRKMCKTLHWLYERTYLHNLSSTDCSKYVSVLRCWIYQQNWPKYKMEASDRPIYVKLPTALNNSPLRCVAYSNYISFKYVRLCNRIAVLFQFTSRMTRLKLKWNVLSTCSASRDKTK